MNLVFFIQSLANGGAERVTANLANYWAERGWNVAVITIDPAEDDFLALHSNVGRQCLNAEPKPRFPGDAIFRNVMRLVKLRRILRSLDPDIAIGVMSNASVLLALAGLNLRCRCIGTERVHPPMVPRMGRLREIVRMLSYNLLDRVVVQTTETENWIKANIRARHIQTIPNPVAWPLPRQEASKPFVAYAIPDQKFILACGRLAEQKGFDILIDAFDSIAARHQEWNLIILGDGDERPALERQIQDLNLPGRVLLPGPVGNMSDWYERASIFVLSSRFEGMPNVLLEAMAHGLPAISFDCDTGPREIIRHGTDGLLIPPEDTKLLALGMSQLIEDDALRKEMSQRAIEVRDRFSMQRIVGMWEDLFSNLLAK